MSYTKTDFQSFLAKIPPFNQLPPEAIASLSNQLQPLRYRMGQAIVVKERLPNQISILYEGQARLLGYDSGTKLPVTLQLLESGSLLGHLGWLRGRPGETAIASTEVICLTLSNPDFERLLAGYPAFAEALQQEASLLEVFDLLSFALASQARAAKDLKALAQEAWSQAQIDILSPGKISTNRLDSNLVWMVSGGGEVVDLPPNSFIDLSEIKTLTVKGSKSARLVGFPPDTLTPQPPSSPRHLQLVTPSFDERSLAPETDAESHRNSQPPTPNPESPTPSIPYASPEAPGSLPPAIREETRSKQRSYPYIKGNNPTDAAVACFQMLSQYFNMPFRREVIKRVVSQQVERVGSLPLTVCGAIAELMGLNAQLVNIPATAVTRLNVPVLVQWQDGLAILYEISDRQLVIGVPELGIIRRAPQDFFDTWGDQGQALLLQPTKETPQQRFGLSWFIPALRKYKGALITVFIASFFVQMFALANPLMIQIIIDKVINQNSPDTLQVLGIFLLVIAIFEALLGALRTYLFVDTTNRIDMSLGSEIIDHLLRLPLRYFERRPVGEISTRVNELENIRSFLTGTALTVVLDAVFSVVYIVVMIIYSPILTAVALATIPVFIGLTLVFSPIIRRQLRTKAERNAQTQSYLVEVMSGIQTVKAQNIELKSRWKWQENYARYVSAGFQTVLTSTLASSTSQFLNKFSALLVLWVGAYLVLDGQLTLGQLIAFRIISGYVTSPLLRLAQLWQNFQETALSLERLADIVDHPQEAEEDRDNIPMPEIKGHITYENLSFRFKANGPLQLINVSLDIPRGTFVAIVGQSGAGKSTLTKLVSRLYEPEAGRILIDGYDISKVELYSLRQQIGFVPQDTLLFDGTVQENIALTNPDASTEEIIAAAQVAAAHEFIMGLPSGYNTRVGERGSALSGGQRQRVAIARSVLQRPEILVLDEATSALDYQTEQEVFLNLLETFQDQTVLFITHRLGTIKGADNIVMMDSGSVIEQGTHQELLELQGRYYYLYQQQESRR